MNVPLVDIKAQYSSIKNEINDAIQTVLDQASFVGGRYLKSFEQEFAVYLGSRHCVGVGNGTDALFIALKALGIGHGDEVITVANSFIATSEAISMTGARVVFIDNEVLTYNMDISKIEAALTPRTKAIIPVHLYGQPVNMARVMEIAKEHGLKVVEDCAQAHGATFGTKKVGTLGDIGCFSFYPGKNLGAYGDGGAIVTESQDLAEKARMMANHGRIEKYSHEFEGVNSRLDALQASILSVKLKYLDQWNKRRIQIAQKYNEAFSDITTIPNVCQDCFHVYHLYVIQVDQRNLVQAFLKENGIQTGIHYPTPLPFLPAYKYLKSCPEDYPIAYRLKDSILSIPIHGSMSDDQVEYVCEKVRKGISNVK